MIDLGTVRPGSTIRIPFSTFDKDDGSSITMTNYAAADILVYKDGSTTERASTSGYTATTDFDAKTGKHLAIIDLADNTTAGFWAAGSEYLVAIDSVTVDTVIAGPWIARFRIGYSGAVLDTTIATLSSQTSFTLTVGPAEDDALNGMWAVIHDIASAVQLSRVLILDYTGSTKTVTLAAGATFTAAAGDNFSVMDMAPLQPTTTGRTLDVSTGGEAGVDWANIGSPTTTVNLSGTTVKTATDVETDTADIQTRLPAALVGGRIDANVGAISGDATAADNLEAILDGTGGTGLTISSLVVTAGITVTQSTTDTPGISITGNGTGAGVFVASGGGASAYGIQVDSNGDCVFLDSNAGHGVSCVLSIGNFGFVGSISGNITSVTTAANLTTNNDKTGYQLSATGVDDIWDEALSGHTTAGTAGKALSDAGAAGDPWSTSLPGAYSAGTAGYIIGTNLNATVSSRSSHSASDVWAVGTRALTDKDGFTISGTLTTLDAFNTSLDSAHGSGSWATATGFSTHSASDVWAVGTRTLTNYSDGSGFTAIPWNSAWDTEVQSECADALAAYGASTYAGGDTSGTTTLLARLTSGRALALDNLDATISSRPTAAQIDTQLSGTHGAGSWATATGFSTHTAADVWAVATRALTDKAGFSISGTITTLDAFNTSLNSAHGAGSWATATGFSTHSAADVWSVGTRTLTAFGFTVDTNANATETAIKAKTDNLPASPAATGDIPTTAQIADKILGRTVTGSADGGRTVAYYLQGGQNKIAFDVPANGQFTVYATDDSTPLYTGTYTATSGANPVTAIDPA